MAYRPKEGVPTPNPKVTSVEDDTIKASKASKGQLPDLSELSLEQRLPRRPGHGTQGTKTTLFANYFQILPKPELELHRYDIAMTPEAVGKKRQRVVEQFLAEGQIALARKNVATDFKSTLVCDRELPPDFMRAQIVYKQEGEDDPLPKAQTYTVSLSKNGRFTVAELIAYLTSTNISAAFGAKADIIQALNIVLGFEAKKTPNSSILSVGANKHYSMAAGPCPHTFDLGVGLRAWRGYFTSVRAATSRLLLNVQIKHVATYRDGSLLELMKEHKLAHNDGKMPLYLQRLEKFLQKLRIQTHHLPPKKNKKGEIIPRVKTIFGLAHHKLDGHGTPKLPKPPIISEFGAGPGFVKFWLEDGGPSSAKKPTPGKQGPKGGSQPKGSGNAVEGGQYITVQDFFKKSKCSMPSIYEWWH